ncbi:hypothetical protein TR51_30095 [Kitasatospora griseola]|uniref:Uncharacterized protein n=1 Tax=Kitasatospora griseola TaxID=2064 RepID=A0A0D0PWW1_KITGR|nr:hypothetical protein TR51_30095 [Kitasatospora griseola]
MNPWSRDFAVSRTTDRAGRSSAYPVTPPRRPTANPAGRWAKRRVRMPVAFSNMPSGSGSRAPAATSSCNRREVTACRGRHERSR